MGYDWVTMRTHYIPEKYISMPSQKYEPTKAEMLAALVIGNADMEQMGATVQRSHRFPLHLFIQIENMAKVAKVPVSVIVNELLDCGLDSVRQKLPEEILKQLNITTKNQVDRPTKSVKVEVKRRSSPAQAKTKAGK